MYKNFIVMFLIGTCVYAHALPDEEIDHLLNFVGSTDCTYVRNGHKHNGLEAKKHIARKYKYYSDKIDTTEDFIKYSATKSTVSGKFYMMHCPSKDPIKSKDWLLAELKRHRSMKNNH